MHQLAEITISNFRSCKQVTVALDDFTPIVGYNNAGKSNILSAIEWLMDGSALTQSDFNNQGTPVVVGGVIKGIVEALIGAMPSNQQKQIRPYVKNEALEFRRSMASPGAGSNSKLEVRNPAQSDPNQTDSWTPNPTGIQQALKTLFPEAIRIHAMQDASADVGKQTKGNTIGKLIADIIEPIRSEHEAEFRDALSKVASKFSADGTGRTAKLIEFDNGATDSLKELFPGIQVKLDVPVPELPELFKNGTVRVLEDTSSGTTSRTFESVGHGAQRCIQMALIRYLAEKKGDAKIDRRTLLLVDEPELYLHPQGIAQVRQALRQLSTDRYQVLFSTHSPLMLHRDYAGSTVMVRKPTKGIGTSVRKPLAAAVRDAIANGGHQSAMLFELGNSAQVFFSDRVVLNEGKTEQRLLPVVYENYFGRSPGADRTGFVPLGGSGNFVKAVRVLQAMEIEPKVVADLDYAFRGAKELQHTADLPDMAAVEATLLRLASVHGFPLDSGLPKSDKKVGWTAADAWALFALDSDGAALASRQHESLKKLGIWVWKQGTIEDALGVSDKGEKAIQALEHSLASYKGPDVEAQYPAIAQYLDWLVS